MTTMLQHEGYAKIHREHRDRGHRVENVVS